MKTVDCLATIEWKKTKYADPDEMYYVYISFIQQLAFMGDNLYEGRVTTADYSWFKITVVPLEFTKIRIKIL